MVNKKMLLLLFLMAAIPMFAQTPGGITIGAGEIKFIGGVIGMGLASGLCGLGQGKAAAAAAEATARNPGASGKVLIVMILGLALIESLAIYTLIIALNSTAK
jgi:F-type H+-transporting ATPase subunit c